MAEESFLLVGVLPAMVLGAVGLLVLISSGFVLIGWIVLVASVLVGLGVGQLIRSRMRKALDPKEIRRRKEARMRKMINQGKVESPPQDPDADLLENFAEKSYPSGQDKYGAYSKGYEVKAYLRDSAGAISLADLDKVREDQISISPRTTAGMHSGVCPICRQAVAAGESYCGNCGAEMR